MAPRRRIGLLGWLGLCGLLLSLLGIGQGLRALPLVDARIDSLRVGRIVLAGHPTGEQDGEFGLHVDPPTWRKLVLRAPKKDGSLADVELLRPLAWLKAQLDNEADGPIEVRLTGRTIHVSVPECGIDGDARVLAVEPCPAIPGRRGGTASSAARSRLTRQPRCAAVRKPYPGKVLRDKIAVKEVRPPASAGAQGSLMGLSAEASGWTCLRPHGIFVR